MGERWAILIVATGGYPGGGAAMKIVRGYPSAEAAKEAADAIRADVGARTSVFPEPLQKEERKNDLG
jgi:hypothetical protein